MDKLKMHTPNLTDENFKKLAELFPNAVTETINESGEVVRSIDADVLRQEISATVVEGKQERYQFTWPDKKKAVLLANQPTSKTLRLVREKSVGRDGTPGSIDTENIYIEGDNLDALKILQETYLGKVKMIYIDPPYNTGNDFIYEDDFSQSYDEYLGNSGQTDEEGNRLVQNTESNGRFHTDWLNMIYPRLRLAKDLLSDDGVIFISIDENEIENLKKLVVDIFGSNNYVTTVVRKTKTTSNNGNQFAPSHEYIIVCSKNITKLNCFNDPEAQQTDEYLKLFKYEDNYSKYNIIGLYQPALKHGGSSYPIECPDGSFVVTPNNKPWRWNQQTFLKNKADNRVVFKETTTSPLLTLDGKQSKWNIYTKIYLKDRLESGMRPITFIDKYTNSEASKELLKMDLPFEFSKPRRLIQYLIKICKAAKDSIVMDFFSGSATTAHAVMQLNAEDGGKRRFIMVQLPEECLKESSAYKAGYKNICDIGEERLRRAGKKICEEAPLTAGYLDIGYRVFKVDSSNMKDVYYRPDDFDQGQLELFADNIKEGRSPEDLLFQVMLDLGVLLSSKIEENIITDKKVFSVADGYLIACFDSNVTDDVVIEIAKRRPFYAVFRDNSMASDSVATNFDQIFETYSPNTVRKVL
jgi:adenine-specific DNA-methyltransferase